MVESLVEIIAERRCHKFYKPLDFNSVTNDLGEIEVSMTFLEITFFFVDM